MTTAMATSASNSSEGRVMPGDGIGHASVGIAQVGTRTDADSMKSLENVVHHPTVKITPAESVKRLGRGWHWWFSEIVNVPIGSNVEVCFQGPLHLLALYNEGMRKNGETSVDGLCSQLRSFVHKLTFVPAGCAYRERYEAGASIRVTFLYLSPAAFERSDSSRFEFLPRLYFEDSLVWETASKLKNAIESGQTKYTPYLEALSGVLAHELSRVDQQFVHERPVSRGGLASWQKHAVVDYIEEHLGEQIDLLTLAELSRLSLHHFCRAFKQSFGIPAHQYQVRRRMDVARLHLADRKTSVTDIGLSLGYAQTSSFSTAFRKTIGWTPSAYRRKFEEPINGHVTGTRETPNSESSILQGKRRRIQRVLPTGRPGS